MKKYNLQKKKLLTKKIRLLFSCFLFQKTKKYSLKYYATFRNNFIFKNCKISKKPIIFLSLKKYLRLQNFIKFYEKNNKRKRAIFFYTNRKKKKLFKVYGYKKIKTFKKNK